MPAREVEAGPPGAERPEKDELRPGEAELLGDERPDARASLSASMSPSAAADDDGAVSRIASALKRISRWKTARGTIVSPWTTSRIDSTLTTSSSCGTSFTPGPPAREQEADGGQHETQREVHPEGRVEVVALELLALDDGGLDPALVEELDERDVDERERNDPEVARAEDRGEEEREDEAERAVAPRLEERPLERAVEGAPMLVHAERLRSSREAPACETGPPGTRGSRPARSAARATRRARRSPTRPGARAPTRGVRASPRRRRGGRARCAGAGRASACAGASPSRSRAG